MRREVEKFREEARRREEDKEGREEERLEGRMRTEIGCWRIDPSLRDFLKGRDMDAE